MPLIECRQLTRSFRRGDNVITPLDRLDLEIEEGRFLALMGPSGSGKTTLLNLLAGIDRPSDGQLVVSGQDIAGYSRSALTAWRAQNVGYVFQLYHLMPVLTAYENVELPLLLRKMSRRERHRRVAGALDLVGLSDRAEHFPRQLSGGQEQRVAIARALVADPPLLLADEPTGDLDEESSNSIMELLSQLHRELGKTLVMVTHDPDTTRFADLTLHLHKGKMVEESAPRSGGTA